ncbi:uncharacterized protein LOC115987147 isoform X1 [Quercus lobata]|uniref:uncharacterized protein LOC115987147 isoform X1 n=1 Tax=Quercus lobata TaxID=97700 RepID=UPI0012455AC7|nr:uncharacterized protein LOC115987147 isoform X1 [Quercus lobata]
MRFLLSLVAASSALVVIILSFLFLWIYHRKFSHKSHKRSAQSSGIEEAQLEGKKGTGLLVLPVGPSSVVDGIEANTFQNILDDSDDEEESGVTTLGESENYS